MNGDVVGDSFRDFLRSNSLSWLSKAFARGKFSAAIAKMSGGATMFGRW